MPLFGRLVFALIACVVLSSCQEDGVDATGSNADVPDLLEQQRTACERKGGRWGLRSGETLFVCYTEMPDANKSCQAAGDCQGLCLARSRTCSPIKPFLGCHEILTEAGLPATQCVN